jgi:haloalkane dehalogenase
MKRRDFLRSVAVGLVSASASTTALRSMAEQLRPPSSDAKEFLATRRFVQTPAGEIAYFERGEGPAALFLHGFPLNGYQWRGALVRLSRYRRCIAPDFLGLGYTRVMEGHSLAPHAQVQMLVNFLDRLGIARADIVANDSGGAVAQLLLAHHPSRVRSLLLTNCDSEIECPPAALSPVLAAARIGEFPQKFIAPPLADKNEARATLGAAAFTHPHLLEDATIETYLAPLAANAVRTNTFALALEANSLAGIGKFQRESRCPVRIVWGTGDSIFSHQGAEHLHRSYPEARGIRWLVGAKLFFPEEFPEVIAEEARELWGIRT